MKKTKAMVIAEVSNLIDTEWERLANAYKNKGCELGVSFKVSLSGNLEVVEVVTGLEYYPLPKTKIKLDPITVYEKQLQLPGQD